MSQDGKSFFQIIQRLTSQKKLYVHMIYIAYILKIEYLELKVFISVTMYVYTNTQIRRFYSIIMNVAKCVYIYTPYDRVEVHRYIEYMAVNY